MKKVMSIGKVTIYWNDEWTEYVVKDGLGGTYHTDDREDAEATAQFMANGFSANFVAAYSTPTSN